MQAVTKQLGCMGDGCKCSVSSNVLKQLSLYYLSSKLDATVSGVLAEAYWRGQVPPPPHIRPPDLQQRRQVTDCLLLDPLSLSLSLTVTITGSRSSMRSPTTGSCRFSSPRKRMLACTSARSVGSEIYEKCALT